MQDRSPTPPSVCELRSVTKRFAGVVALDAVSFNVAPGQVHALLGENGAGKSTLVKVLTGLYAPDSGQLLIAGQPARLNSPHDARTKGISLVSQDVLIVPTLSVGRNILLGSEERIVRRDALSEGERGTVEAALTAVGADFGCDRMAGSLSVPQQRLMEFARALVNPGRVLVLDEPTAALSEHDSERLVEILASFRDEGKAIVYVTHRLSEALRLADRITVLRDGRVVSSFKGGEKSREEIVGLMAKDDKGSVTLQKARRPPTSLSGAQARIEVEALSSVGRFDDVGLCVAGGRILGIAGVQGSGHGDVLMAIAGVIPSTGRVTVNGVHCRLGKPAASFARGILLVPADRRRAAIMGDLSVRDNVTVSRRIRASARRLGLRWPRLERQLTMEYVHRLSIRPASSTTAIRFLSGGNQQKVVLSRALEGNAQILLVDEPTQGIDIHAKAEILRLLKEYASAGGCVIVATSEFEELRDLADEVVVLCKGQIVGRLHGDDINYRNILVHALP